MTARIVTAAVLLCGLGVSTAVAQDWTPHAAAALLDTSFPTAVACLQALGDARRRESRAAPIDGLSYTHLFEQARCDEALRKAAPVWRIRMHWKPRVGTKPRAAAQ